VEILDLEGKAYRFERGVDDYTEYHKLESHESKDDAKEAFANKLAKARLKMQDSVISGRDVKDDDVGNDQEGINSGSDEEPPPSLKPIPPVRPPQSQSADVMVISDTLPHSSSDELPTLQQLPSLPDLSERGRPRTRGPPSSRISKASSIISGTPDSGRGRGSRTPKRSPGLDDQLHDGQGWQSLVTETQAGAANDSAAASDAGKGRRRQDARDLEDAQNALAKATDAFSNDNHLEHCKQASHCTNSVNKLRRWARKLSKSADAHLKDYSQTLFDYADEVEERQGVFEEIRSNYTGAVLAEPSAPRAAVLKSMSSATICTLISKEAHRVSDDALCNELTGQALFKSLVGPGSPDSPAGVGLYRVVDFTGLLKSTQKPATHNHLEKILKEPTVGALANGSSRFFGNTSLASMSFEQIAHSLRDMPAQFSESDALVNGWDAQLWADLCCVHTMGLAAKGIVTTGRIPGNMLALVRQVVADRLKLSGRVRCYQKHIGGVSHSSRDTWAAMEAAAAAHVPKVNCTHEQVSEWVLQLRTVRLAKGPLNDILVALGEVICDPDVGAVLLELAKWCHTVDEQDDSLKDLRGAVSEMRAELVECIGVVIWGAEYHEDAMVPYKPNESDTQLNSETAEAEAAANQAGTGTIDRLYFDDPDNLSDAVAMVSVTGAIADLLKEFPGDEPELAVIREVVSKAAMVQETWKVSRFTVYEKHNAFDHLRALAAIAREYVWKQPPSSSKRPTLVNKAYGIMQTFVDKVAASDSLNISIRSFVGDLILKESVPLVALRRELSAMSELQCDDLEKLATVFDTVEQARSSIVKGKAPSITDMNNMLHTAATESKGSPNLYLAQHRPSYVAAKDKVAHEFGSAFSLFESRVNRMAAGCRKMEARAGHIIQEIEAWNFTSCAFVKKPKDQPDLEVLSAAKVIENAKVNFNQWHDTVKKLSEKQAHLPAILKEKMKNILADFDGDRYPSMLKQSCILVAHSSIVSCILNSPKPGDRTTWPSAAAKMLVHSRNHLGMDDSDWAPDFLDKIVEGGGSKQSGGGKKRTSGTESTASTTATASTASSCASASSAAAAPKSVPRTKFRRM
jgi:hypothetical protein